MSNLLKRTVGRALAPLDLVVCRTETYRRAADWPRERERHLHCLKDTEAMIRASAFPELPEREGRHELMAELNGTAPVQAFHLVHYLHKALPAGGDVCEFGVAEGATSALIANEILRTERALWLFDSFQGLPPPTEKDQLLDDIFKLGSIGKYAGTMAFPERLVRARLARLGFPEARLHIVPGYLEESIKTAALPQRVCFAYVDFDFYAPILLALRTLDSRLAVGGFVIVDDYGFFSSGAATATDEFVAEQGSKYALIQPAPFTRGFVILEKRGG